QHLTRFIFIFQENALGNRRADDAVQTPLSFTVRSCSHNGLRYFVIGDASPQNLDKLSGLIKAASWAGPATSVSLTISAQSAAGDLYRARHTFGQCAQSFPARAQNASHSASTAGVSAI